MPHIPEGESIKHKHHKYVQRSYKHPLMDSICKDKEQELFESFIYIYRNSPLVEAVHISATAEPSQVTPQVYVTQLLANI